VRLLLTILDLTDVADDDVANWNVNKLAAADRRKAMFVLNATLKSTKLFLFLPVVERCDEHDNQHCDEDRDTFDPARFRLRLIRGTRVHSYNASTRHSCML